MKKIYLILILAFAMMMGTSPLPSPAAAEPVELAFDIWDWTAPAKDTKLFETWVNDLKSMGFTRVELSVPWRALEPRPGQFDLSFLTDRLAICKRAGLGMRLRINSYYAGATPDWYDGDRWKAADGSPAPGNPPSINDDRFWSHYAPLCTALARACQGEDVYFSPFIGIHAELKWSDWWTYDAANLARWRQAIQMPRPAWLNAVVDPAAPLPQTPPVPTETHGHPDLAPATLAFIAFREQCWREAMERFAQAIHAGDPQAKVSAPLGESYRRGSAQMSNLDYWGLSRGAAQVVHSYDFFWHAREEPWLAGAAVCAFRGITGLPVSFEFDGYNLFEQYGYSDAQLLAIGRAAAREGAGFKAANYSYSDKLPSSWPVLCDLVRLWQTAAPEIATARQAPPRDRTVLLFISKWTNLAYREPTEWLHDAQFGLWRMLTELGVPTRIICEDNLDEDLAGYRALIRAFSPPETLPRTTREKLESLKLPTVIDVPVAPEVGDPATRLVANGELGQIPVADKELNLLPCNLAGLGEGYRFALGDGNFKLAASRPGRVVLGWPIGRLYMRGQNPDAQIGALAWALSRAEQR